MAPKQKQYIEVKNTILTDFRKAVFQNAKCLLSQAEESFAKGHYPVATFLSITVIEEMGKFYLSRVFAIKNSQNQLTDADLKDLFNHPPKQRNSFLPPLAFENNKMPPTIGTLWELVADNKLMTVRNNCLYVGLEHRKKILTPDKSIPHSTSKCNTMRRSDFVRCFKPQALLGAIID